MTTETFGNNIMTKNTIDLAVLEAPSNIPFPSSSQSSSFKIVVERPAFPHQKMERAQPSTSAILLHPLLCI